MNGVVDFRRFVPAWLAFGLAVGWTVFGLLVLSGLTRDPEDVGIADVTPVMVIGVSLVAHVAGWATGLVLVPFRRLFLGPRFPFARRGYLAFAILPFVALLAPVGWFQRIYIVLALEVFLLVVSAVFIVLGRRFGAFDDEELRPGHVEG